MQEVDIWAYRLENQALTRIAQRETAEQIPKTAGFSALDGSRELEPRQLPVVESISALSDKTEPGPKQLRVEGASALSDKSELGPCPP